MNTNSVIDSHIQRAIKKNAIKDTTAPVVFLLTTFAGFIVGYPLIRIVGALGIIVMIAVPAASTILVLRKRKKQIAEITQSMQNAVRNKRNYSDASLERSLGKGAKTFSDAEYNYTLAINQTIQKWILIYPGRRTEYLFDFSALIDFEIYEDGNKLAIGTQFNGISFGRITDVCKNLRVEIVVNAARQNRLVIPLIIEDAAHDSTEYRYAVDSAKEICSLLSIVKADNAALHASTVSIPNDSIQQARPEGARERGLDELGKLFELKKQGIITEEEFSIKKRQILGV